LQFTSKHPVTLRNTVAKSEEVKLGGFMGWTVYGNYHAYTQTCITSLKNELYARGIQVSNNSKKSLDLQVVHASLEPGLKAVVHLKVKTASGLEKEYIGFRKFEMKYVVSRAYEMAMGQCLQQMLNDQEIVHYLAN